MTRAAGWRIGGLVAVVIFSVNASPSFQVAPALPADETPIRIDGANALFPLASALRGAWRENSEDVEVALGAGLGVKAGLDALSIGAIDIALSGHEPDPTDLAGRGMTAHRIAVTAVVFAVHADVTVLDLKPGDLCDIYSGKVTSWAALGGPPISIKPFLRPPTDVDTEVAHAGIPCLKDLVFGRAVVIARTTGDMRSALQSTPGAIGLTTSGVVRKSIVALRALSIASVPPTEANVVSGRYPLVRPAYLITRSSPPPPVLRFLVFARSDRGATAILDAGAIPVPSSPLAAQGRTVGWTGPLPTPHTNAGTALSAASLLGPRPAAPDEPAARGRKCRKASVFHAPSQVSVDGGTLLSWKPPRRTRTSVVIRRS